MTDVVDRLTAIRRHRRSGVSATNKPVTLLWALGRLEAGAPRLTAFADAEPELRELLAALARDGTSPGYAFWRLQHDGIWEVMPASGLKLRSGDREPTLPELRAHVAGGFTEPIHAALRDDPDLAARAIAAVVEMVGDATSLGPASNAGSPDWLALLDGLPLDERRRQTVTKAVRDRRFSRMVLAAYDWRCAVCGFAGRLGERRFGVQAAHVQPVAAEGPDLVLNGLALCALHHLAFDAGAFTFDSGRRLVVSPNVQEIGDYHPRLATFAGQELTSPTTGEPVADERLAWHRQHVFRHPTSEV